MTRTWVFFIAAAFTCGACGDGAVQSLSSPTPALAAVATAEGVKNLNLSGTVFSVEKPGCCVPDARVEIADGADAGRSTVADGSGNFMLSGISAGTFTVRVSKPGYQTSAQSVTASGDKKLRVDLFVQPPTDASGATATARCSDGTWSWATTAGAACTRNGGLAYGVCPGPLCKQ